MPDIEIARLVDRLMRRIHASLNATAPDFDIHRIGPSGGILLLTLAEIEPARIQDLVRHMSRDKSQMTRGIQSLETKGLVAREDCPDDARVTVLTLTPMGHETVRVLQSAVADSLADILSPLTTSDQKRLKELLSRI